MRSKDNPNNATLRAIGQGFIVTAIMALAALSTNAADPMVPLSRNEPLILDMVHHVPGGVRYETKFENPDVLRDEGYNGKVYFLFDSPTLAINWSSVDPDIFPAGSPGRAWVDAKAANFDEALAHCKAAGLRTYAQADLILFPKRLVEKYKMENTFGNPTDAQTARFLRLMVAQVFDRFPALDGLVVRIGETYLQDAPYHTGAIQNKTNAVTTVIPLVQLLRDEICVKRSKQLVFRTWLSFDTDPANYSVVDAAIEPHPNLFFAVKHCEDDFHRGNAFSRVIGMGRHRQIIEVQCAREYEGKGAYPNYIGHGVIEGFEEHLLSTNQTQFNSIGAFARQSPLFAGIWTWSRGGGWDGPYIKNELWCELNAYVMAQWARDPRQSEASVFTRFAQEKLGLKGDDVKKFRRLCLLSADAVLRGKSGIHQELSPWWSRDDGINRPRLPADPLTRISISKQQEAAVTIWQEIVRLAGEIHFANRDTADYVKVSSNYGLDLYRIYQAYINLTLAGLKADPAELRALLKTYDEAWNDYRELGATHANCPSLYLEHGARFGRGDGIEKVVAEFREKAEVTAKLPASPSRTHVLNPLDLSPDAGTPGAHYEREATEWVTTWIPSANVTNLPRVLLVGDSITKGYAPDVTKQLQPSATCTYFTTSASVADPAYALQLQAVLDGYQFAVIHFNNGLHGWAYSEEEYKDGYERALKIIRQSQPRARLILGLTTPLRPDSPKAELNPRVDARNAIVRDLARQFAAEIDDLHAISYGHAEYYVDPFHYKPEAISLQAAQVAKATINALAAKN